MYKRFVLICIIIVSFKLFLFRIDTILQNNANGVCLSIFSMSDFYLFSAFFLSRSKPISNIRININFKGGKYCGENKFTRQLFCQWTKNLIILYVTYFQELLLPPRRVSTRFTTIFILLGQGGEVSVGIWQTSRTLASMTRIPLSNTRSLSPVTASKPNPLVAATSPVCPHIYPVFIEEWRKEDFLSFLSMMIFIAILHPNKNKYLSCCIWFRISGLNSPSGQK